MKHANLTGSELHSIVAFTYASAAARAAAVVTAADVHKAAYQSDDGSYWLLTNHSPVTWLAVTNAGLVATTRSIIAGAGLTGGGDLSADRTLDVVAGDASLVVSADSVAVGVVSDAQHGTRAGGTLHPAATGSVAGFLAAADKTKLDALPATAPPTTRTLTAGAGLTGGGDLTADRIFDVVATDASLVVAADGVAVNNYALFVATAGLMASWGSVSSVRYYALDPVTGNDANVGYSDVSGPAAGLVAKATWAALKAIIPVMGCGRRLVILVGTADYAVALDGVLIGYESVHIRGTGTVASAGATSFANDATDKLVCGATIVAGTESAGYLSSTPVSTSVFDATKVSGGTSPAWTVDGLVGKRVRFTSATTTVALRNKVSTIWENDAETITLAGNLAAVPAATDTFVIEEPGAVFTAVLLSVITTGRASYSGDGLNVVGIRTSLTSGTSWALANCRGDVVIAFCGAAGAFHGFYECEFIQHTSIYRDEAGTSVACGGSGFTGTGFEYFQCDRMQTDSSAFLGGAMVLNQIGRVSVSTGTVVKSLLVQGCGIGSPRGASSTSNTIGHSGTSTGRPVRLLAPATTGVALNGSPITVYGLDGRAIGANAMVSVDGLGLGVTINGLVGASGNTGPVVDLSTARGCDVVLGVVAANTATGAASQDVKLAGPVYKTWADVIASDFVDQNGNHVQGTGVCKTKKLTLDTLMNAPVATADPSSLVDGDIWLRNAAGVVELSARVGGVTKRVTLA